jgi:hypothetical protein
MGLTPLLVARSQLLTAIDLFFADHDPVSVQALAGNAQEILETLCLQSGVEPIKELMLRDHAQKQPRDYYSAANLYRDCFKHAGRSESELRENQLLLDQFDDTKNDYLLYVGVDDYRRLRKAMPIPFQIFQAWFCVLHSELLPLRKIDVYSRAFPGIRDYPRAEQKKLAVQRILESFSDARILSDARTEPLQLVD